MKWLLKIFLAFSGTGIALGAPIIPVDEKAVVWWEPYKGAETCFARYPDGTEKELPCEEYWTIANTPEYPQPERTQRKSIISKTRASAATFDAASKDTDACIDNASSVSWSHTSTGSNVLLVAGSSMADSGISDMDITAATYNSISLSSGRRDTLEAGSIDYATELWYLNGADTGTLTVALTFNGSILEACSQALTIADFDEAPDRIEADGNTATGGSVSTTVSPTSDAWAVDIVVMNTQGDGLAPGASQTERIYSSGGGTGFAEGAMSTAEISSETAISWSETSIFNPAWSHSVLVFSAPCDPSASFCTDTFTTAGFHGWDTPANVTEAKIACWGGGGGGRDDDGENAGGGGGGGGAFASSTVSSLSGHYTLFVGSGGTENNSGATSTFATTTVVASPGYAPTADLLAGAAGLAANSTGDVTANGGAGGAGNNTGDTSGGGGGAAGPHGAGGNGSGGDGTDGGAGGQGDNGQGGAGGVDTGTDGSNGTANALGGGGGGGGDNAGGGGLGGAPGGGGGGGEICDAGTQCEGAVGRCEITYTEDAGGEEPASEVDTRQHIIFYESD